MMHIQYQCSLFKLRIFLSINIFISHKRRKNRLKKNLFFSSFKSNFCFYKIMLTILPGCLLVSACLCLFLIISSTFYIIYVIKHRSTNVGLVVTIAQNILKRKILVPLIILVRFHLPFPILLIIALARRKSSKIEGNISN